MTTSEVKIWTAISHFFSLMTILLNYIFISEIISSKIVYLSGSLAKFENSSIVSSRKPMCFNHLIKLSDPVSVVFIGMLAFNAISLNINKLSDLLLK